MLTVRMSYAEHYAPCAEKSAQHEGRKQKSVGRKYTIGLSRLSRFEKTNRTVPGRRDEKLAGL